MKTVLFVPGFQENIDSRNYQKVIAAIERKDFRVVFVPIQWKRTTIDDWVRQLARVYGVYAPKDVILAGFSYGAMMAMVTAADRLPSQLWLFSLSPYFEEDIPLLKPAWLRAIGKRRVENFKKLPFATLTPKITCKTLVFYGEAEGSKFPDIKRRCELAAKNFKNAKLVIVPRAGHAVDDDSYVQEISTNIHI